MKKIIGALLVPGLFILSSCEDKGEPDYSKAKQIGAVQASVYSSSFTPSEADIDLVNSAREGNLRRVTSLLEDKKAFPGSADADGNTALMMAAKTGNTDVLEAIIDIAGEKIPQAINNGNKEGRTALHFAAEAGNAKSITILREAGANPNIYDVNRNFPLMLAVTHNHLQAVRALLDIDDDMTPTNPDIRDADSKTVVHVAAERKYIDMMKLLAEYKADFNVSDIEGNTPLIYSIIAGDPELLNYLLANGADINQVSSAEKTALIYSIENERYTFTKVLLDKGADPNIHSSGLASPLQLLVNRENANPEIVQYIVSKGAKLKDEKMPLGNVISRAVHKGNAKVIEILLRNGASVQELETTYSNGIHEAIRAGDEEIALLMVTNGADISKLNEQGFSPLARAARSDFDMLFKALVEKGADVNQGSQNSAGVPLEIVIDKEKPELLELMMQKGLKAGPDGILLRAITDNKFSLVPIALKYGARPDIMNSLDQPVLWLAVTRGELAPVKQLVEAGASLEVKDAEKKLTPLSAATVRQHTEIAKYLLSKGADPNNADMNGITPFAYAALTGQEELMTAMLEKGANVNATDKSGRSILKLMDSSRIEKGQRDSIKARLIKAGAQ